MLQGSWSGTGILVTQGSGEGGREVGAPQHTVGLTECEPSSLVQAPPCTDGKTEAQRGQVTSSGTHSRPCSGTLGATLALGTSKEGRGERQSKEPRLGRWAGIWGPLGSLCQ